MDILSPDEEVTMDCQLYYRSVAAMPQSDIFFSLQTHTNTVYLWLVSVIETDTATPFCIHSSTG